MCVDGLAGAIGKGPLIKEHGGVMTGKGCRSTFKVTGVQYILDI